MRFLFPLITLLAAGLTIKIDRDPPLIESRECMLGACREDQLVPQLQKNGASAESAKALLLQDPASPSSWCTYGEYLAIAGDTDKAIAAFDRALEIGSGLSPILMRVVNFDFTHGRVNEALRLVPRILSQTGAFDNVLFSYLELFPVPVDETLGEIIPADARAAQAWLEWVRQHGSPDRFLVTWQWMRRNHLDNDESARLAIQTLWGKKLYADSYKAWRERMPASTANAADRQLVFNPTFENEPQPVPFDWHFAQNPAVEYHRDNGLEIKFLGTDNVELTTLDQAVAVYRGRYRITIDFSAEKLTTDQGPFFRISDVEEPKRLTVETEPILGSRARGTTAKDFTVTAPTQAVRIQLVRRWSPKIDSKIKGTLHIFRVSLVRLPLN